MIITAVKILNNNNNNSNSWLKQVKTMARLRRINLTRLKLWRIISLPSHHKIIPKLEYRLKGCLFPTVWNPPWRDRLVIITMGLKLPNIRAPTMSLSLNNLRKLSLYKTVNHHASIQTICKSSNKTTKHR